MFSRNELSMRLVGVIMGSTLIYGISIVLFGGEVYAASSGQEGTDVPTATPDAPASHSPEGNHGSLSSAGSAQLDSAQSQVRGFSPAGFEATIFDASDLREEIDTVPWSEPIDFELTCFTETFPYESCKLFDQLTEGGNWSAQWTGTLIVPADGDYTFRIIGHDDGARILLDDSEIVDMGWRYPSPDLNPSPQTVAIPEGEHDFIIDYEQRVPAAAILQLRWSGPDFDDEVIPLAEVGCAQDVFEPDDQPTDARPLSTGEVQERTMCSGTSANPFDDEDWLTIAGEAGGTFVAETFNLVPNNINPNADTFMRLIREPGDPIGERDDRGLAPGGESPFRGSRLTWHPSEDRTFLLRITATGTDIASETGYHLQMWRETDFVVPDDQATWAPTSTSPPLILRSMDDFGIQQLFSWDDTNMANFLDLDAAYQWEFNRKGKEYLDYWSSDPPECRVGFYWTDLPDATDVFTEESEDLGFRCNLKRRWSRITSVVGGGDWNEEFEIKSESPEDLVAGRVYTVRAFLRRDVEDREKDFFEYSTESEYCGIGLPPCDYSIVDDTFRFKFSNMIQGLTKP